MTAISKTALNRALLARQLLLTPRSSNATALEVIERVAGLQAQQPKPAFVGLWSRIRDFRREQLLDVLHAREALRATMMRGTLHIVSRRDYSMFRGALQPMLTGGMQSILRERAADLDIAKLSKAASKALGARPRTFAELRAHLSDTFPGLDERAMGYAVRMHLPVATVPDSANAWAFTGDSPFELAACEPGGEDSGAALVRRYLAAFGPASVADFQAWSGMKSAKALFAGLDLVAFRDGKRELFDLPDAPRPGEDAPAPPACFVAGFDNLVLAHADRSHVLPEEFRSRVVTKNLLVLPTILVDGMVAGTWQVSVARKTATLTVTPFAKLSKTAKKQLESEGEALARFVELEGAGYAVAFAEA